MKNLEYMDEYYLEPNQTIKEKFLKVYEEFNETLESFRQGNNNSHKAEEVLDLILSSINLVNYHHPNRGWGFVGSILAT
ncbi:MAG: hypothetical protein ACRC5G_01380 [Cetobacterium sp.]